MKQTDKIKEFCAQYEARFNRAMEEKPVIDAKAMAQSYSDCFIAGRSTWSDLRKK